MKKIKTALISVSDKTNIVEFAKFLISMDVKILSTGGTASILHDNNIKVTNVSEHTKSPEIMNGRVKTLHPKIHGGILARRDDTSHLQEMVENNIEPIDMVVVNLYPFEKVIANDASYGEAIENIDIGGPSMVRSAAKNHADVVIITDIADYATVRKEMTENAGSTDFHLRKALTAKAFMRTAEYDTAIAQWFAKKAGNLAINATLKQKLRYGENPHQGAEFYQAGNTKGTLAGATQIGGKELSYNNINDADAALALVREFTKPTIVIVKHANPCGVASADTIEEAYKLAFSCDSKSAFGGIIASNYKLNEGAAIAISKQFAEVIITPTASEAALAIFAKKKNLRVLLTGDIVENSQRVQRIITSVSGGFLAQDTDDYLYDELKTVTKLTPTIEQLNDMEFAYKICKHIKSNAIVFVKNSKTIGIGAGQMSRIDSVITAARKASEAGLDAAGATLASDAFFPFDDNVHEAAKFGITSIIQPGGSIRDDEVIKAANEYNIAMVFAGVRHFKH